MNRIEEITEKLLSDLMFVAPEDTGMQRTKIYMAMMEVVTVCANTCERGRIDRDKDPAECLAQQIRDLTLPGATR